jgi:hypothetical protein
VASLEDNPHAVMDFLGYLHHPQQWPGYRRTRVAGTAAGQHPASLPQGRVAQSAVGQEGYEPKTGAMLAALPRIDGSRRCIICRASWLWKRY